MIPLIILRLLYLMKVSHSSDRTYDSLNLWIITEIAVNLSVVTACVPFSKPFADGVQSGVLGGDIRFKKSAQGSLEDSTGHTLQSLSRARQRPGDGFLLIPESSNAETVVTTGTEPARDCLSESTSFGSDRMIIRQTTGFTVHSEQK